MNRYQWKYIVTGPKLVLATLTVVIAMVLAGGIAFAGVGAEVNEAASLRLTSTGVIRSSLKGFVRLQLQVSELNGTSLRARAQVESDGLIEHRLYGMWLSSPEGNALLIDTARADEECEVDPDTGKETGCERVLDLRGFLTQAPSNVTTLEGLTINIREQVIGTEATTPALATATVFSSDLTRFNIANPHLILDADMASPVKDLHNPPATVRSSGMPALVATSIGSPFDEEERKRLEEEEEEEAGP